MYFETGYTPSESAGYALRGTRSRSNQNSIFDAKSQESWSRELTSAPPVRSDSIHTLTHETRPPEMPIAVHRSHHLAPPRPR